MTNGYDLGYESAYWFSFPDRSGAEVAAATLRESGLAVLDEPQRLGRDWVVAAWDRGFDHRLDLPFAEIAGAAAGRYEGCQHSIAPNVSFACRVPSDRLTGVMPSRPG